MMNSLVYKRYFYVPIFYKYSVIAGTTRVKKKRKKKKKKKNDVT